MCLAIPVHGMWSNHGLGCAFRQVVGPVCAPNGATPGCVIKDRDRGVVNPDVWVGDGLAEKCHHDLAGW